MAATVKSVQVRPPRPGSSSSSEGRFVEEQEDEDFQAFLLDGPFSLSHLFPGPRSSSSEGFQVQLLQGKGP